LKIVSSLRVLGMTATLVLCACEKRGEGNTPLRLSYSLALPGVNGRIDHFAIDVPNERLFVCAIGNNSVEVIDLRKGERIHSINGLGNPQGAAYIPELGKLFVANDENGAVTIYDGKSFSRAGIVDLKDDADNVRYDAAAKRIYVGYGNGGIAVIDPDSGKEIRSIKLSGHPEAFVLENHGSRIFVNIPTVREVAVIDRDEGRVIATWRTGVASANFPMAFDETNHRLFVGCRSPAQLVVLDSDSGAILTPITIPSDPDDIFFDEKRHRLFAICGAGSIAVIDQISADTYKTRETIATSPGARTGLFVPELNSLFVAIPHYGSQNAEVRRYSTD
jgi:DNA-binding beta-propeller fold protein YncE